MKCVCVMCQENSIELDFDQNETQVNQSVGSPISLCLAKRAH